MSLCMIPKGKKSDMRTLAMAMKIVPKKKKSFFNVLETATTNFVAGQREENTGKTETAKLCFSEKREKFRDYTVKERMNGIFL